MDELDAGPMAQATGPAPLNLTLWKRVWKPGWLQVTAPAWPNRVQTCGHRRKAFSGSCLAEHSCPGNQKRSVRLCGARCSHPASAIPINRKASTTLGEITCAILSTPPTLVLKANPTAASKPNPLLEPVRRTFTTSLPQPAKDKMMPIPAANPKKKTCMSSRASVEKVTTCRTWNKCDQFHN